MSEAVLADPVVSEGRVRGENKGHFKPGHDVRRPADRDKEQRKRTPVEEAGNPLLTAYRHVLANRDRRVDQTVLEKEVRELLKSHRKEFLARYDDLEREESARKKSVDRGSEVEDDQADEAERLAGVLIAEWGSRDADQS